jgi:NTP pyrophosphatase (non-canonical NTP hydrolase)
MDNHEDVNRPLRDHKTIDWIGNAETLIPTYSERLIRYIEKHDNKLDESDFIKDEIKKNESLLEEKNQFTYGINWKIYKKIIETYISFLKEKQGETIDYLSKNDKSKKYSTNDQRVYALMNLCPELFDALNKLHSRDKAFTTDEIGKVLSYILNINPVDARKKGLGHTPLNVDGEFKRKIKLLKDKIEKIKGEK